MQLPLFKYKMNVGVEGRNSHGASPAKYGRGGRYRPMEIHSKMQEFIELKCCLVDGISADFDGRLKLFIKYVELSSILLNTHGTFKIKIFSDGVWCDREN